MKDDSDSEKQQQIHHIKNLYAFNLFCQKRFDESMQVFAKLGTGNKGVWPRDEELNRGRGSWKEWGEMISDFREWGKLTSSKLILVLNRILWVAV